jgi:sorbitol-specific phosphotransferase system component IIA
MPKLAIRKNTFRWFGGAGKVLVGLALNVLTALRLLGNVPSGNARQASRFVWVVVPSGVGYGAGKDVVEIALILLINGLGELVDVGSSTPMSPTSRDIPVQSVGLSKSEAVPQIGVLPLSLAGVLNSNCVGPVVVNGPVILDCARLGHGVSWNVPNKSSVLRTLTYILKVEGVEAESGKKIPGLVGSVMLDAGILGIRISSDQMFPFRLTLNRELDNSDPVTGRAGLVVLLTSNQLAVVPLGGWLPAVFHVPLFLA